MPGGLVWGVGFNALKFAGVSQCLCCTTRNWPWKGFAQEDLLKQPICLKKAPTECKLGERFTFNSEALNHLNQQKFAKIQLFQPSYLALRHFSLQGDISAQRVLRRQRAQKFRTDSLLISWRRFSFCTWPLMSAWIIWKVIYFKTQMDKVQGNLLNLWQKMETQGK